MLVYVLGGCAVAGCRVCSNALHASDHRSQMVRGLTCPAVTIEEFVNRLNVMNVSIYLREM